MITFAPSPKWKDLIKLLIPKRIDLNVLAQPWLRENDRFYWFSRTAWSLQAIVLLWENIFSKKEPCVWVPGYFCNQSLWPLRQTSAKLVFYPVGEGLQPNWQACEQLLVDNKPDIFILTHYYGLIIDSKKAKDFCDRNQAMLVEDAAHVLVPIDGVGVHCHISLYSPHKHFAIPHGALSVVRPSFYKYIEAMGGKAFHLDSVLHLMGDQCPRSNVWLIKRIIQKLTGNRIGAFKKHIPYEEDGTNHPMPLKPNVSNVAKKLLFYSLKEIPEYIQHRRECAQVWDYLLSQHSINVERVSTDNKEIPYVAVYNSKDNEAAAIYDHLARNKWPVSSWPDLPPEVRQNSKTHQTTIHFRNNMLIFPTNQSLNFLELVQRFGAVHKKTNEQYGLLEADCEIWNESLCKIQKTNLLQSWAYGKARAAISNDVVKHYIIIKGPNSIALLQIRQKKIGFLTLVRINRGPLWLHDDNNTHDLHGVLRFLRETYSLLKGFVLVLSPELPDTMASKLLLYQLNYRKLPTKKIGTIWVDLSLSKDQLRKQLRSNWRRQLGVSERHGLQFELLDIHEKIDWFLDVCESFKREKKFDGLSKALIHELIHCSTHDSACQPFLFQVSHEHQPIAAALFLRHGSACTYLLVWNDNEVGRQLNVSNFLLWNAILTMKEMGCLWLDLGGISEANKEVSSITHFKRGLSGHEHWQIGEYLVF